MTILRESHIPLETFPAVFWDVLASAVTGREHTIELPARNYAVNLRHRFHNFRKSLIRERYPNAAALTNVMCSIREVEGKWMLVFVSLAGALQGTVEELQGLETLKQGVQQGRAPAETTRDHTEDAMLKFLGTMRNDVDSSDSRTDCEHEWNLYDVCVKCHRPRA